MNPRASFVIPAYNAAPWISKTLHSCRTQTIKQIEIIVVNDGSTDMTRQIVEHHAKEDSRIRLFNQENAGRSAARNFGNDQAQSDLILVLDADDMATRNRAKDTIAAFQLKKPSLLYGSFWVIDSIGNTLYRRPAQEFDPKVAKEQKMNFICHSTMAYTKQLSEKVRYEEGEWSRLGMDDWKFQWEAYKLGASIKCIRNPLCYYRVTESGTMGTRDESEVTKAKEAFLATV